MRVARRRRPAAARRRDAVAARRRGLARRRRRWPKPPDRWAAERPASGLGFEPRWVRCGASRRRCSGPGARPVADRDGPAVAHQRRWKPARGWDFIHKMYSLLCLIFSSCTTWVNPGVLFKLMLCANRKANAGKLNLVDLRSAGIYQGRAGGVLQVQGAGRARRRGA